MLATLIVGLGIGGAVLGGGLFAQRRERPADRVSASPVPQPVPMPAAYVRKLDSPDDLLKLPADRLVDIDIAEMNLLCATGLPGSGGLDIDHALATLDRWAARVKFETDRHLYRVTDPDWAAFYRRSEPYLRAYMLVQVLQQDLGVKYDLTAKDNFAYNDSRVAFIHDMIPPPGRGRADAPGGTRASMPVLYVAVGRRLGYPLNVVATKGHLFARWDGLDHPMARWRERFNFDGAGDGFAGYDDAHYMTWPFKITDAQVKANGWLVSLSARELLAGFLAGRGHCYLDNGRLPQAARCYENAYRYDPARPSYRRWFLDAAIRCGYRPATEELARLLDHHKSAAMAEWAFAQQEAAARRQWLAGQGGDGPFPPGHAPPADQGGFELLGPAERVGQGRSPPGIPGPLPRTGD